MTTNKKPEVLAPAGDMEKLKFAIAYGADAVYLGGEHFGLRVKSNNFTLDEIAEAVKYCHERDKKVYITVNIFAHNDDIEKLPPYLSALNEIGPDALLISDPFPGRKLPGIFYEKHLYRNDPSVQVFFLHFVGAVL